MADSMGPGKWVRHVQSLSYTYDIYLICMELGPRISPVIAKSLAYSGPSYASLPVQYNTISMPIDLYQKNVYLKDLHILEYIKN